MFHPRTFHERNYSQFWVPYSLLSIGSQLDPTLYSVSILDNNLEEVEEFAQFDDMIASADLVGITTMLGMQVREAVAFAKRVREISKIPIVIGGPAAILTPRLLLDAGHFDYVVSGQGELSFNLLVRALFEGEPALEAVPNLHFLRDGQPELTLAVTPQSRDNFKPFNFDLIDVRRYLADDGKIGRRVINYVSSQGCRWRCGFCSDTKLYSNKWISESEDRMVGALAGLQQRFGIDGVKFYDSNFDVEGTRVIAFCQELERQGITLNWAMSIHPYTLYRMTDSNLDLMRKNNCRRLLIGAESGDDHVLKLVRKGLKTEQTRAVARRLAKADLCASYTFVVGLPGVDDIHYHLTMELAEELLDLHELNEVKVHFYLPFPGTPLSEISVANGWRFPETIDEWATIDYYNINAPWVPEQYFESVRALNMKGCPAVN